MTTIDAYARLLALRKNIPSENRVPSVFVTEYNDIVSIISKESGVNLDQYKVADEHCQPYVVMASKSRTTYSKDSYCNKDFLSMKADSLINRFQFMTQNESPEETYPIGFKLKE